MSETVTVPAGIQGVDTSGIFFYKDTANHPKLIFYMIIRKDTPQLAPAWFSERFVAGLIRLRPL